MWRYLYYCAVLVGKKNLEVRPIAINKVTLVLRYIKTWSRCSSHQGEIVKRIVYKNPDAQFIFCAGDDKVRSMSIPIFTPFWQILPSSDRRRHVPFTLPFQIWCQESHDETTSLRHAHRERWSRRAWRGPRYRPWGRLHNCCWSYRETDTCQLARNHASGGHRAHASVGQWRRLEE